MDSPFVELANENINQIGQNKIGLPKLGGKKLVIYTIKTILHGMSWFCLFIMRVEKTRNTP